MSRCHNVRLLDAVQISQIEYDLRFTKYQPRADLFCERGTNGFHAIVLGKESHLPLGKGSMRSKLNRPISASLGVLVGVLGQYSQRLIQCDVFSGEFGEEYLRNVHPGNFCLGNRTGLRRFCGLWNLSNRKETKKGSNSSDTPHSST